MSSNNIHSKNKFSFFLISILLVCIGSLSSYNTLSKIECLKDSVTFSCETPQNSNESNSEKDAFDDAEDDFFTNEESILCIHSNKIYDLNKEIIPAIPLLSFDIQIPPPKNKGA